MSVYIVKRDFRSEKGVEASGTGGCKQFLQIETDFRPIKAL